MNRNMQRLIRVIENKDSALAISLMEDNLVDLNQPLCEDNDSENCPSPLHYAARYGLIDVIRYLLDHGSNPLYRAKFCEYPITWAAKAGQLKAFKMLWGAIGVDKLEEKKIDIINSVIRYEPHIEVVRWFVEQGVSINEKLYYGHRTLLGSVIYSDDIKIVEYLIQQGADVDVLGDYNKNVFEITNNLEIIKVLIKHASQFDAESINTAIREAGSAAVELLIEKGIDLNQKDDEGLMPIHITILNENIEVIRSLLKVKVDIQVKDQNGYIPIE
ncbi:hypothetical protein phytr_12880 [Candidatus Phycorickettsia trachydisci]|uniref:Uncharacterized protein n=1 Tax=Candidatus Phycorickettsia trachydisci TaxID=2115978 RepID=A0A2P1PA93_9RICK|nr:ankyrin repeat domain-containing protein [Candidatus Phycorickettsia trachydisci]AVP88212.1 hypothetical protein phytr_12880 [Candidatus Phycorickettsia trachydisci]